MDTLYDLLGALPHDDAEGLRSAFRKAVKGAHPDLRPGDKAAEEKLKRINVAFEILKDAESGMPVADLLRKHGISKATFFKWRSKYGGASVSDVKGCASLRWKTPS